MRCIQSKVVCQWKKSVIHLRLLNLTHKSRRCENCVRKKVACQLIWEGAIKRPAESDSGPEPAANRTNVDPSDLDTSLEAIDKNISALVKFSTSQVAKTDEQSEVDNGLFDSIHASLEDLHEG